LATRIREGDWEKFGTGENYEGGILGITTSLYGVYGIPEFNYFGLKVFFTL
jgi:hypothetical protein